jgi:hypothetical protein
MNTQRMEIIQKFLFCVEVTLALKGLQDILDQKKSTSCTTPHYLDDDKISANICH